MDPITLVLILVALAEVGSGGFLSANVAGGVAAGGKAAGREAASGGRQWYAKRAKRMKKTAVGRWRLRTEATVAGGVALLGRGVAAGVKAAPGGARQGRQKRRQLIAAGRQKVAQWRAGGVAGGVADGASGGSDGVDGADSDGAAEEPAVASEDPAEDAPVAEPAAGEPEAGEEPISHEEARRRMAAAAPVTASAAPSVSASKSDGKAETSPASGEGEKESNVSDAVAEDRGVAPYLAGWDGETGGLEGLLNEVQGKRDRLASAAEANQRHEVGGVDDVIGRLDAAVAAIQAAGEAVEVHRQQLHDKWDTTLEHLNATGADSAQELAGAH